MAHSWDYFFLLLEINRLAKRVTGTASTEMSAAAPVLRLCLFLFSELFSLMFTVLSQLDQQSCRHISLKWWNMLFPDSYFDIYSQYRLKYNDIINQIFIKSTVEKEDKSYGKEYKM